MKVAVLGTGLLGRPIAERLAAVGHDVVVYNRTPAKAAGLEKVGITVAHAADEAIGTATCVLLVLADAAAIRHVLASPSAKQRLSGRTVIQMGTIAPRESLALEQEVHQSGGAYLEAPVLGSIAEVRDGRLIMMVGASPDLFQRWADLLRSFDPVPRLIGPVGHAAALKLALNHLIAAETAAFALSLGLVQREGVPVETFMKVLRDSAVFAPTFDKKLPRLLKRDYTRPNFSVRHLLKDVDLFLQEAAACGLDLSSLEGLPPLLHKTMARGLEELDYSALFEVVNPR